MQIATIKPDGLKLHKGPGSTYRVIDVLSKADSLTVLAREGCWAQVRVARSKQVGWVYGPDLIITDHFTGAHGPSRPDPVPTPVPEAWDDEPDDPPATSIRWFVAAVLIAFGVVAALWFLP